MGVCKQAVNENVDFKIETVVLGTFRGSELRTGFINCTGEPLPAFPFTLHGRVIVYCEQSHSLKCLIPVGFSDQQLAQIKLWGTNH